MIKSFSLAAMAALVLVGCGGGGDSASQTSTFVSKNTKVATIGGLESLGNSVSGDKISSAKLSKTTESYDKRESSDTSSGEPCESGTMSFTESQSSFSMNAQNCKNGLTTVTGAFDATISEEARTGKIEVTEDFSLVDEDVSMSVSKGSKLTVTERTITANFQATVDNEVISADNISISYAEQTNGASFSFTSGEVNIGGYYFKFVAQPTPFVFGEDGLVSGLLKLTDGAGHAVEIAVENDKSLALKIDENGNGTFEDSEIKVMSDTALQ